MKLIRNIGRRAAARATAVLAGMLLLAGCGGLHIPDPAPYVAACDHLPDVAGAESSPFFFVSTSVPDCREQSLEFTNVRSVTPIYGRSVVTEAVDGKAGYRNVQRPDRAVWLDELETYARRHSRGRVIVYVHGYYNDFSDQIGRAQTIARLAGQGAPVVLYDWTSRKRLAAYTVDSATAAWAQGDFDSLIADLAARGTDVTVIAHSMGNRVAINALLRLGATRPELARRVRRIVLASPDFDRDQAQRSVLPALLAGGSKIVVYASSKDRPIQTATGMHGYALLGSTRCRNDIDFQRSQRRPGLDCYLTSRLANLAVVDTSEVAAGVTRHADFMESCLVRRDLAAFLNDREPTGRIEVTDDSKRTGFRIAGGVPCSDPALP